MSGSYMNNQSGIRYGHIEKGDKCIEAPLGVKATREEP